MGEHHPKAVVVEPEVRIVPVAGSTAGAPPLWICFSFLRGERFMPRHYPSKQLAADQRRQPDSEQGDDWYARNTICTGCTHPAGRPAGLTNAQGVTSIAGRFLFVWGNHSMVVAWGPLVMTNCPISSSCSSCGRNET
jgi:hypothetical protein